MVLIFTGQPSGKIEIQGPKEKVQTNDFITSAPIQQENFVVLYYDSNFAIQFDKTTSAFQITFNSADRQQLKELRPVSEEILLNILGIKQSDACKLYVVERIQQSPALTLNNYIYGLSFCGQSDKFAE